MYSTNTGLSNGGMNFPPSWGPQTQQNHSVNSNYRHPNSFQGNFDIGSYHPHALGTYGAAFPKASMPAILSMRSPLQNTHRYHRLAATRFGVQQNISDAFAPNADAGDPPPASDDITAIKDDNAADYISQRNLHLYMLCLVVVTVTSIAINHPFSGTCLYAPLFQWTSFVTGVLACPYFLYFLYVYYVLHYYTQRNL